MSAQATVAPSVEQTTTNKSRPDFGNGRYSPAMEEFYDDAIRIFNWPHIVAEKIARQFGADFGAAMKNAAVSVSVSGKVGKKWDGRFTLKEAAKEKVVSTHSITLARIITHCNESYSFGVNIVASQYVLHKFLQDYVDGVATDSGLKLNS